METNNCLFCKIVRGEIPANVVLNDSEFLAFRDINPVAPTHVLVIPKQHVSGLSATTEAHTALLGHVMHGVRRVAETLSLGAGGFRTVINDGAGVGQSVFHLHAHVIAGRPMAWPPG